MHRLIRCHFAATCVAFVVGGAVVACDSDPSESGGRDPVTVPSASPGEGVVNVHDGSEERTLRCGNGVGLLQVTLRELLTTSAFVFVCKVGDNEADGFSVSLQVIRPTLTPGTYDLVEALSQTSSQTFGVVVTTAGNGFAVGATTTNAATFTGELTLEEAGIGPGTRVRGSFTANWERVGTVTSGTVTGGDERAGGLAAAFDVTQ